MSSVNDNNTTTLILAVCHVTDIFILKKIRLDSESLILLDFYKLLPLRKGTYCVLRKSVCLISSVDQGLSVTLFSKTFTYESPYAIREKSGVEWKGAFWTGKHNRLFVLYAY